ncbi:PREDICTED: myelin transcription factor 1-like, partial [Polistes dominula]|uniref:Myelin transcription factor 1-like n=1 Tax=Polistes dominula TaxID=743375 RepID=A0ABM1IVE2_POLDO
MSTQAYYKERLGFDPADTVAEHHREQRSQHGYEESLSKFKEQNQIVLNDLMVVVNEEQDEEMNNEEQNQMVVVVEEDEEVVVRVEMENEEEEEEEEERGVEIVEEIVDVLEEQKSSNTQTAFWGCWAMFIESH